MTWVKLDSACIQQTIKSNRKTAIITVGIQVEIYKCPLFTSLRKILCIAIAQFLNSYYDMDVAHCGQSKII